MRVIIAGSRSVCNYDFIKQAVVDSGLWKRLGRNMEVVSGMAKGVDSLAVEFAQKNSLVVHEFPADWDKYKKGAGFIRNKQMAENADILLAIWDGESNGTKHMIDTALEKGLEVIVYTFTLNLKRYI